MRKSDVVCLFAVISSILFLAEIHSSRRFCEWVVVADYLWNVLCVAFLLAGTICPHVQVGLCLSVCQLWCGWNTDIWCGASMPQNTHLPMPGSFSRIEHKLIWCCICFCVIQSISVLFYICSKQDDVSIPPPPPSCMLIIYLLLTYYGLWTINLTTKVITSVLYKISYLQTV